MSPRRTRTISVEALARVEGEGALDLEIKDNRVEQARLRIFEPPRFFEAFLRGRDFREAPDITARICGICPVAYLMGACHAMEMIAGVQVGGQLRELRRLLYCGEWIESHALHVFMLHAPDFLGYQDAIQMAQDHPDLVTKALRLKKLGNDIMRVLGGREIHPINIKLGGFYRTPRKREVQALREELLWGREFAIEATAMAAALPMPELERDYEFVGLRHRHEYPLNEGQLVSNKGLDVPISQYDDVLKEVQVRHSTALHTHVEGRGTAYVGPLARFNLNRHLLTPAALEAAARAGLGTTVANPFQSIVVRCVELVYAVEESMRIIGQYEEPDSAAVDVEPRAGTGYGCTEAPRGVCYHRYTIDDEGTITDAKIVAPTSINQPTIEADLRDFAQAHLHLSDQELQWRCEQAIRNYDPCISCSCHFLKLNVIRR